MCCSPWGHKESDTTERLNRTELTEGSREIIQDSDTGGRAVIWRPIQPHLAVVGSALWTSACALRREDRELVSKPDPGANATAPGF